MFEFELTTDEIAAIDGLDTGKRGGPEPDAITLESFGREEAHKAFSHLGADPFVQACATELAHLHVTAAAQGAAALLGLTRAELAVARLVARGLTNRQAAAELFVSVKTVEYHLRNCYMKLDITSRQALASLIG